MVPVEDAYHFLFSCPLFNDLRTELSHNLRSIAFEMDITKVLVGDPTKSPKTNCIAMLLIQDYILKTEKF